MYDRKKCPGNRNRVSLADGLTSCEKTFKGGGT